MSYLNDISILKVFDRKAVTLMSRVYNSKNTDSGKKDFQTKETIQKPLVMIKYNKYMGGDDLSDQLLKYSHFSKQTIKWWKKAFFRMLNICMLNAFILWKEHLKKKGEAYKNTQTDFRVCVTDKLVNNSFETMSNSLNDSLNNFFVGDFERLADNKHFRKKIPVPENSKKGRVFQTCKVCSLAEGEFDGIRSLPKRKRTGRETQHEYSKCKVALFIDNCFEIYHTQKVYVKKYINEF